VEIATLSRRSPPNAARALGWALLLGLAGWFVATYALRYFTLDPAVLGRYGDRAAWLLLHIGGGMVALLAGPLQFWTELRQRRPHVHRRVGKTYLAAVAVSSVAALALTARTELGWVFAAGLLGLTVAWLSTSGLALVAIRRRRVAQHREWMVRSYVVTFAFVTFRIFNDALSALQVGTPVERAAAASWFCWAVPLLVTELVLQGRKVLGRDGVPAPAPR
jgi:uncharacterized membrane protein